MKYIVLQVSKPNPRDKADPHVVEFPFIFPEAMIHLDVADALTKTIKGMLGFQGVVIEPIAAGFMSSMATNPNCNGKSSTLGVGTRGAIDDALIKMLDYGSSHK